MRKIHLLKLTNTLRYKIILGLLSAWKQDVVWEIRLTLKRFILPNAHFREAKRLKEGENVSEERTRGWEGIITSVKCKPAQRIPPEKEEEKKGNMIACPIIQWKIF